MMRFKLCFYICLTVVSMAVLSPAATADPGARPMGMGGAFVAVTDGGAYSSYYNPAGLASGIPGHLTYSGRLNRRQHPQMPRFNDYFGVALSYEIHGDTFGIGFSVLRDRNELTLDPDHVDPVTGRDKDRHMNLGLAYKMPLDGRFLGRSIALGANLKSVKKEWSSFGGFRGADASWNFDYDIGLLWEVGGGLSAGLVGQHFDKPRFDMGEASDFDSTGVDTVIREWFNLKAGLAWRSEDGFVLGDDVFTLALDMHDIINESRGAVDRDLRVGAEWVTGWGATEPGRGLVVRAGGYHFNNSDYEAVTGGIGFRSDAGWSVDYSLMTGEATDDSLAHMIGLGYSF